MLQKLRILGLGLLGLLPTLWAQSRPVALSNAPATSVTTPPNAPARLITKGDSLLLEYERKIIFRAYIKHEGDTYRINTHQEKIGTKVYQTVVLTSRRFKPLEVTGIVTASEEAFPCESDAREGLKVVRHVVGMSRSLLNRAVYERKRDWLLSVDDNYANVVVTPTKATDKVHQFEVKIRGNEIALRFRPHFYRAHRGLSYFAPWAYQTWQKPVVGWCSWFAYFDKITEADMKHVADVVGVKLKPFGLEYLQMDDGYQQLPIGLPETWLKPNHKFPNGLENLAQYIKSKGLKPAIWTNVSFADSAAAALRKQLFVTDAQGNLAEGRWVGYPMDGSNSESIQQLVAPVYEGLHQQGWEYVKLDALRHLRYEGYNAYPDYFERKKANPTEAFRNVVKSVRRSIGDDTFLLGCWGIRPELVGLINGCRIGTDGYGYAGLAQYNSYNNVVWRNDPDHIELSEKEAYRSTTATSLTGSLYMLTDKPAIYESSLIEAAKRTMPVPVTHPAQVYDVDPSRSALIERANVEMSGSGPRIFDANYVSTTGLFLLEIAKPFEDWMVLGRLDEHDKRINFKDLGLDSKADYLLYEFWTKSFKGVMKEGFDPEPLAMPYRVQAYCIRAKQDHPQLLATNRHVTCGMEIGEMAWQSGQLSGKSEVVLGDDYILTLYEPQGYTMKEARAEGAMVMSNTKEGDIRRITLRPESTTIRWGIRY
jgi:hypothetical protein